MIIYTDVDQWLNSRVERKSTTKSIQWVLERWSDVENSSSRALTPVMLRRINKEIKKISTGKRRAYQLAVLDIILYLSECLRWSIPAQEKRVLQDAENKWYQDMRLESKSAQHLCSSHQQLLESKVKKTFQVDAATVAISLLLDVAPLSIASLFYILSHPDVLEVTGKHANIFFPVYLDAKSEFNQYARYRLSPLCYRLLVDYYKINRFPKRIKELKASIDNYLSHFPFYFEKITERRLMKIVACHWEKKLPQFFLEDFMNPNRQFALSKERYFVINNEVSKKIKNNNAESIFATSFKLSINSKGKDKWPHKELLVAHKNKGTKNLLDELKEETITWSNDNILPQLYYLYTLELIKCGGVKKSKLMNSSMVTYTSGLEYFSQNPLSFECAKSEDDLNEWAKAFYENVESDNVRSHILDFLKFVAEYELTDALDIDVFKPVHQPHNTDANLVTAKEFQDILQLLANETPENPLQQNFSMLAAILGFHGGLRRGEIIRLRVDDVMPVKPNGNTFRLHVTNTKEGKKKNGKPRFVHMHLSDSQANILRLVLELKKVAKNDEPLLCFAEEKMFLREQHYLLPVTRAMKVVCGGRARFHHLRHGSAFVLTNQLLTLFSPHKNTHDCPYLRELLQLDFLKSRLSYWIEDRHLDLLNSQLALDQVAEQIGHSLFDTTRKSYLHDHDWLYGYFIKPTQLYSKAMLRYILKSTPGSNDISRRIKLLLENSRLDVQSETHYSTTLLTTRVNEMVLNTNHQFSWFKKNDSILIKSGWEKEWNTNIISKSPCFFDVLIWSYMQQAREEDNISWQELSRIKLLLYSSVPPKSYLKPTLKLIKKWLANFDLDNHCFIIECNRKNAEEFNKLFALPEFKVFSRRFILFKNLNTLSNQKESFLEKFFLNRADKLIIKNISSGKSRVVVNLELKAFPVRRLVALYREFFN